MPTSPRVGDFPTMRILRTPEEQFVEDLGKAITTKLNPPSEIGSSDVYEWQDWADNSGIPYIRHAHMDSVISLKEKLNPDIWVFAFYYLNENGNAYFFKVPWEYDTTLPWMLKPSDSILALRVVGPTDGVGGRWDYDTPDEWTDEVFLNKEWNRPTDMVLFAVPEADLRDFINRNLIPWASPVLNWSEMPWKLTHETLTSYSEHGWCPKCRRFGNWEIWGVIDETSAFQKDYESKILAKEVSAYPTGKTVFNGNPQYMICLSCKAIRGDDSLRRPDSLGDLFG